MKCNTYRNLKAMNIMINNRFSAHYMALLVVLSCRGARYRELKPFVRILKGLRNIAEQIYALHFRCCTHRQGWLLIICRRRIILTNLVIFLIKSAFFVTWHMPPGLASDQYLRCEPNIGSAVCLRWHIARHRLLLGLVPLSPSRKGTVCSESTRLDIKAFSELS